MKNMNIYKIEYRVVEHQEILKYGPRSTVLVRGFSLPDVLAKMQEKTQSWYVDVKVSISVDYAQYIGELAYE